MQTRFIIFRHGETDWNLKKLLQGRSDIPLNENGRKQAAAGRKAVEKINFDMAFSSDYCRARESAEIILEGRNIPVQTDKRLREWNAGDWEGVYAPDFFKEHPETIPAFVDGVGELDTPNGESRNDMRQRLQAFFKEAAEKYPDKTILICIHGAALRCVLELAVGRTQPGQFLPLSANLARNEIVYDHDRKAWGLVEWNYRGHLEELTVKDAF
ncbi:MAG: histidine phosphatase family protein [Lentisphaeria bacterium]|nr:histidine phosphatase family protein [Lentisphaeria bacterium]MBQ8754870.1 histidine phosphatase family protein [Lentisphaeria bacterium]